MRNHWIRKIITAVLIGILFGTYTHQTQSPAAALGA
jgi:hypothetical protein